MKNGLFDPISEEPFRGMATPYGYLSNVQYGDSRNSSFRVRKLRRIFTV